MKDTYRIIIASLLAYPGGAWIGAIAWAMSDFQLGGPWYFPMIVTSCCVAIGGGIGVGKLAYWLMWRSSSRGEKP